MFKDNSFDMVYSNTPFQHLPHKFTTRSIMESHRVLRGGGFLIFQVHTFKEPAMNREYDTSGALKEYGRPLGFVGIDREQIVQWVESSGFKLLGFKIQKVWEPCIFTWKICQK